MDSLLGNFLTGSLNINWTAWNGWYKGAPPQVLINLDVICSFLITIQTMLKYNFSKTNQRGSLSFGLFLLMLQQITDSLLIATTCEPVLLAAKNPPIAIDSKIRSVGGIFVIRHRPTSNWAVVLMTITTLNTQTFSSLFTDILKHNHYTNFHNISIA